jgi:hypothetical protein
MPDDKPHDQIRAALDVLTESGLVSAYVFDANRGYVVQWTPIGRDYAFTLRTLTEGLSQPINEKLWSAITFLAQLEGSGGGGDSVEE